MACGVSGIVLATWGALTSSANCNSAKARRTTRTCCTPPFRRLRNSCWSFLVTSILRGGRPIPRVCAKTILHKNGLSELFQAVRELVSPGTPSFLFSGPLVFEHDRALGIGLVLHELEIPLRKATREQRNARAERERDDSQVQLIHQIRLQEVSRELAAAHEPDVFSLPLSDLPDDSGGRLIDEDDAVVLAWRFGARKDVIRHGWIAELATTELESDIESLAAHHRGIDRGVKSGHRETLGHDEIVDSAVRTSNVAVKRDGGAQYDATHLLSTTRRDCARCASPYRARR